MTSSFSPDTTTTAVESRLVDASMPTNTGTIGLLCGGADSLMQASQSAPPSVRSVTSELTNLFSNCRANCDGRVRLRCSASQASFEPLIFCHGDSGVVAQANNMPPPACSPGAISG